MSLRSHMEIPVPVSEGERDTLEESLSREVQRERGWSLVTGVTLVFDKTGNAHAVAVSVSTSNWRTVEMQHWSGPAPCPYKEGMESFREGPPLIQALLKLHHTPDVIFVNGHGQAHPRKFGTACHVGIRLNHPTIGVGQRYPVGCGCTAPTFAKPKRGNSRAIMLGHQKVGYEIVLQEIEEPIYVSVGNRLGLDEAVGLVLKASPFFRLPEPLRQAELEAKKIESAWH